MAHNGMTTISGQAGDITGSNVGNFGENPEDLDSINDAQRYAEYSQKWAVSPDPVEDGINEIDDSSKTYATEAKIAAIFSEQAARRAETAAGSSGSWDVPTNNISGDILNNSLTKDVAPNVLPGDTPDGIKYTVVAAGSFDLFGDGTLEVFEVGDEVIWNVTTWILVVGSTVSSVNTLKGEVIIHGENANIDDVTPSTIKGYIDTADSLLSDVDVDLDARITALENAPVAPAAEGVKVGGLYLSMNGTPPNIDLGYGVWVLITGDAQLSFGDGTVRDGIASGSNTPVVPLPEHSHTSASHTHANTATFAGNALADHNHSGLVMNFNGTVGSDMYSYTTNVSYGSNQGSTTIANKALNNSAGTPSGSVTIANAGASAIIDNAGTAGATLDVRGSRITINVWKRTA